MGCSGSSNAKGPTVQAARRRLSVGHVDGAGQLDEAQAAEDDRGLISTLKEEDILQLCQQEGPGGRKFSIGSGQDAGKQSFGNKKMETAGDQFDPAQLGLGYTCRKGLKPEAPNQDSWCIIKMEDVSLYGVFDGHGQKGHEISLFVKDNLPKLIIRDPRFKRGEGQGDVKAVLRDSFRKMQSLIATSDQMQKFEAKLSGTTATVVVHDHIDNKLYIAHVADSTSVLGYRSATRDLEAVALTRDHKPDLKEEKARIEKAGGRVVFDGYANHRVYAKNGRYPGLNMSRCLGDLLGHQDCGVSCDPEVSERLVTSDDHILLLCSDGVWEFMSPAEAVNLVSRWDPTQARAAEQP
eukprot:TRINITY_DN3435_c0_g1_i5.p1 TRINITY_DN3435_c0_g1~~TRINITY_DN3435_c0_g1_i5.p1  ORF type:complete len:351 (-),score=82.20 TRINITY_DN3435_c0_g1_i5:185-1237(-)